MLGLVCFLHKGVNDEENNRGYPNGKDRAAYVKLPRKNHQGYGDAAACDDEGPKVFIH
jgi:hypothetical protein